MSDTSLSHTLPAANAGIASGLLSRIKSETSQAHQALERDLDFLNPAITIESYRSILERFYGFYEPFETWVMDELSTNLKRFFNERRKVPYLLSDLRYLGSRIHEVDICRALPRLNGTAQTLGACYVVEGATLGGQLIARHLERKLGFTGNVGYSFFASYGPEVGSRWRSFRELLLEHSSPESDSDVVRGAQETFQSMHGWLCPVDKASAIS